MIAGCTLRRLRLVERDDIHSPRLHSVSPQGYSFAFGVISLVSGFIAGRLSERWSERGTLTVGLIMSAAGALGLLATALLHLPLFAIVLSLFTMVSGVAVTSPPATSLALKDYPDIAGTASSLLGLARYAFGGIAAPLVGIGGANDAVPFGIVAAASVAAAVVCLGLVRRRRSDSRPGGEVVTAGLMHGRAR